MLDRERVLMKIDEMRSYLQDLKQIMPLTFDEYQQILVKRSCERLLQLSIGYSCNADCPFCYYKLSAKSKRQDKDLTTEQAKNGGE